MRRIPYPMIVDSVWLALLGFHTATVSTSFATAWALPMVKFITWVMGVGALAVLLVCVRLSRGYVPRHQIRIPTISRRIRVAATDIVAAAMFYYLAEYTMAAICLLTLLVCEFYCDTVRRLPLHQ